MLCAVVVGPVRAAAAPQSGEHERGECLGPCDVVAAGDGRRLLVLLADAGRVAVVEPGSQEVTRTIDVPDTPTGLVLDPAGRTLYVTCAAPQGTVCAVDWESGTVRGTIEAGHGAGGPAISPDGRRLYVCNRFDNDVSVIDLEAGREVTRVAAVREPVASAVTPDGKWLFVANLLPADRANQHGVDGASALLTVVDTQTNRPTTIRLTTGSSSVRGLCVSPDGSRVYVAHVLSRYHLPTIQVERGWMNANAMTVIDVATRKLVNTVLLDELERGAANPWDVACTADGQWICVTHAGTDELSVIDAAGLSAKLKAMPLECYSNAYLFGEPFYYGITRSYNGADVANNNAFLEGLRRRIKLEGNGPRGLAVVGSTAYVVEHFSDTLAAVDLRPESDRPVTSLALGPAPVPDLERKGQMWFCDATLCFEHWQSCESCHPDARADGLNWDLLNDGSENPKNTKSMLLAHETPPAMATAVRPTAEAAVRSGIAHIEFGSIEEEVASAIDAYLKSLEPVPSPQLVGGELSERARRGRELFFSDRIGCATCHPAPWYTDLQMHDVGTQGPRDRRSEFDTPALIETWRTAPYLHDGRYTTIRELIARGKHGASEGKIDSLTEQQIDDLVEFVLSL